MSRWRSLAGVLFSAVLLGLYSRGGAAFALGFVALVLFAAAVLGLAFLVRRRQPRLGLIGMLAGIYESPEQVYAGIDALKELGVGVHSPHQWFVDFEAARTQQLAASTDPRGLLNPGKLVADAAAPGMGKLAS